MARKNLLAGLTGEKLTAVNSETSSMAGDLAKAMIAPFANFTGGHAVSRSIEQIKQQACDRSRADRSVTCSEP